MCINTGGEKVFPEEVEAVLKAHPDVLHVLVDDQWGAMVTAVVETRSGDALSLEALREHARADLAAYKVPRLVVPVEAVVRGPNGKPDYRWAESVAASFAGHRMNTDT